MKRFFFTLLAASLMAVAAQAHFVFVVPAKDGATATVILSDDLDPDDAVDVGKVAAVKLFVRDAAGKDVAVEHTADRYALTATLPGSGPRVVYGSMNYGVMQKGEGKPFKLTYYPKAVLGTATAKPIGEKLPLEVVAAGAAGKLKFQVLAAGKAAADLEVTVMLPDASKKMVKTDKEGFTPEYGETGRFGVVAKLIEAKAGEHGGKKFEEVRAYATLVCDIGK